MTSKSRKNIDKKPIQDLSALLDELDLTEISYQDGDFAISVSRAVNSFQSNKSPTNSEDSQNQENNESDYSLDPRAIKSPMVGTCYLSPEPGSKPFVSIGSKINKGDPIIIIEAMKTFNTIPSTESGVVKSILVEEGQPIEFGQNIIEIE